MTILPGEQAPDFEQDTANGSIRFHAWLGASWGLLFSHPHKIGAMFATDVAALARLGPEWAKRGLKVVCLAADTAESLVDIEDAYAGAVDFPMIADCDRSVATLYGLADALPDTRAIFLIDPARLVRRALAYPSGTGCNFAEVLDAVDRLQQADAQSR